MFQTTNQKSGASNTIQMWKSRQLRRRGIQPLFRRQWTSTDPHGRQPGFAALPHLQPLPHRPQWMGEPWHKTTGNAELKEKVLSFPSNFVHFLVFANVCLQFHVIVHLKVHVLKFHFLRTTASVWCVKCVCVSSSLEDYAPLSSHWPGHECQWLMVQCLALSLTICFFSWSCSMLFIYNAKRIWTTTTSKK